MAYTILGDRNLSKYPIALFFDESAFNINKIKEIYIKPLMDQGISINEFILFKMTFNKTLLKEVKEYLNEIASILKEYQVEVIYMTNPACYKVLMKTNKTTNSIGYLNTPNYIGYTGYKVILGINHQRLYIDSSLIDALNRSLKVLIHWKNNTYIPPGTNIIKKETYLYSLSDIKTALRKLLICPQLIIDIETTSLKFWEAEIETISFCYANAKGVAFPVYREHSINEVKQIKHWLKQFFLNYKGTCIYHNGNFDIKVLIYYLFMDHIQDIKNLLIGLDCMTNKFEDTKIISYLALNSTASYSLKLKDLTQEFAGDYAILDGGSTANIPTIELLKYNLIDTISTYYLFNKYYSILKETNQDKLYYDLLLPTAKVIIQMELIGMPINSNTVNTTAKQLLDNQTKLLIKISNNPIIQEFNLILRKQAYEKAHAKWKVKTVPLSHFDNVNFNINSDDQLRLLLFTYLQLPINSKTESGLPSVDHESINKLIHTIADNSIKELLQTITEYTAVTKITNTFLPILQSAPTHTDKHQYIHGSFNIGGTVTGRLSSSNPNLTNLPSNSVYGTTIKNCFQAPKGMIMVGADFNGLEDRISALTTKDPNKLKVFIDGYDGHSLRAYFYFKDLMPSIKQATETDRCFQVNVGGTDIRFLGTDIIEYMGVSYTGLELYEFLTSTKL